MGLLLGLYISQCLLHPLSTALLSSYPNTPPNFKMERYVEKTLACPPVNVFLATASRTLLNIGGYLQQILAHPSPIPSLTTTRTPLEVGGDFGHILTNPRPVYLLATSTRTLLKTGKYLEQILTSSSFRVITLAIVFVAVLAQLVVGYFTQVSYPANLPRVREPAGATRFSLRTRLAYYTDCKALYNEAYETVTSPHYPLTFHAFS